MPQAQGSSINDAWAKAMASYKRQLNSKQLQTVQALTSPEDIVKHMEQLKNDRMSGKSGKLLNQVKSITDRLVRFSTIVDVMTTSNAEASLVWGSLKLLLTIVHQSSEEYERICQSLVTVGESLQVVELLAETFSHSPIVSECVVKYYCSILHFWRKAIKYYRRRKFVNLIRGAWNDYNSEFGEFEAVMMRFRKETQKAAVAVDMSEARKARQQQDNFIIESMGKSRSVEESRRHREIIKWLTPATRDANYYGDDFESACRDRHIGTCEWIFRKPEFQQWVDYDGTDPMVRMLWISAIAGAGKTVLAAFIIAHCREHVSPSAKRPILYFFFKNTDDEKNSLLSMTRSFLHQLYVSFDTDDLNDDLASLKEDSGKDVMLSDERAWNLFLKHARKLSGMIVVLDALDECKLGDTDELLDRLCSLVRMFEVRVIVTSRREERIRDKLESWPCISIQQQDVDADIKSFVIAKIGNIARLNSGLLRDRIIRTLSSRHEGMFLWVYFMIKELKSLATAKEVEERLLAAPKGLKQMHQAIITRLGTTLSPSQRVIARKILSWVVSAIRPLRLAEIHEILRFEIKRDSATDDLLFSEKDLELICGSLVTVRNGVLRLIHLSTKEILQEKPGGMSSEDPCWPFYIDVQEIGPRIALLCTSYIATHQCNVNSYIKPDITPISRLEPRSGGFDLSKVIGEAPFIEYAYTSWQGHLLDGKPEKGIVHEIQSLLSYRFTLLWLEFRLTQDPESLWKLERNCIAMQDWVRESSTISNAESKIWEFAYLGAWCEAMLRLLKEHGRVIKNFPEELHFIDIRPFFSSEHLTGFQSTIRDNHVREREVHVDHFERAKPKSEVVSHRRLLPQPENHGLLGFFLYDEKRDVFYYSESWLGSGMETLWVQDRQTGRRLPPLKKAIAPAPEKSAMTAIGAAVSRDSKYLSILYKIFGGLETTIWELEDRLDFHDIKQSKPWARRLQSLHTNKFPPRDGCCALTIGPDNSFCTPSGLVDPHWGVQQELPLHPGDPESRAAPIFSGDGRIVFYSDSRKIYKIFWLDPIPITEVLALPEVASSLSKTRTNLVGNNYNGDYLVFTTECRSEVETWGAYIINTRTGAGNALWDKDDVPKFDDDLDLFFLFFWNDTLILILSEFQQGKRLLSGYRWDDVTQDSFDYWRTKIEWPSVENIHLQIVQGSTKAFLVLGDHRILNEVDMREFPNNTSPRILFVKNNGKEGILHYQVSSNGHFVGYVYYACDETIANEGEVFVQITDLRPFKNSAKYIKLCQDAADGLVRRKSPFQDNCIKFSDDLSLLYADQRIYDLISATHDMAATYEMVDTTFSWYVAETSTPLNTVIFSPCNQYICAIDAETNFKIYELCRSKTALIELCVDAQFSRKLMGYSARFHPHLPILLVSGSTYEKIGSGETWRIPHFEVIEIDVSRPTLEAVKLPPSHLVFPSKTTRAGFAYLIPGGIRFSDCGRLAWACFRSMKHDFPNAWNIIAKSYPHPDEALTEQMPSVWRQSLIYNKKIYSVTERNNLVMLELNHRLSDGEGKERNASVRITSIPHAMRDSHVYLLPGHDEEEDPVRVLLVVFYDRVAMIKVLPVTMKEILAKLDEMAEMGRTEQSPRYL